MCGYLPFQGKSEESLIKSILKGVFYFNSGWEKISEKCISFIEKMLTFNPGYYLNQIL